MFSNNVTRDSKMEDLINGLENARKKEGVKKVVVGAVIANEENEVLVLRRALTETFMAGLQEIPSGTVEPGENISEALVREVFEETGLRVDRVKDYLGSFDYLSKSERLTRQLNFSVSVTKVVPVLLNAAEHDQYKWVSRAALESSGCSKFTQSMIKYYWTAPRVTPPQKFPVELEGKSIADIEI